MEEAHVMLVALWARRRRGGRRAPAWSGPRPAMELGARLGKDAGLERRGLVEGDEGETGIREEPRGRRGSSRALPRSMHAGLGGGGWEREGWRC